MTKEAGADCPTSEEILRWSAGHYVTLPRHEEIEAHLAGCPSCGVDLTIAVGVGVWIAEEAAKTITEAELAVASPPPPHLVARIVQQRGEAIRLFGKPPTAWRLDLLSHRDAHDSSFLWQLADQAIPHAISQPDNMLAFLPVVRGLVENLPQTFGSGRNDTLALLALVEGVAYRTKGEHVAALKSYAEGERQIDERALSHEYARLNLARASSLRYLDRLDEAEHVLILAAQGFARLTDTGGEAKAVWELANIAYQRGDAAAAVPLAERAHATFLELGDHLQASIVRLALFGFLVAVPDVARARERLAELQSDVNIQGNPQQAARLRWLSARLAATEGDHGRALLLIQAAAEDFARADAPWLAASALIDAASLAGEMGNLDLRTEAASRAVALLSAIPGQTTDRIRAIAELQDALRTGARIAETLAAVHKHLRAI